MFYFYSYFIPIHCNSFGFKYKEKKNRKAEEIELTGGDECKGERGDRNGGELIWRGLPAKN